MGFIRNLPIRRKLMLALTGYLRNRTDSMCRGDRNV